MNVLNFKNKFGRSLSWTASKPFVLGPAREALALSHALGQSGP
jgi:hypothetical protein